MKNFLKTLPRLACCALLGAALLALPRETADGVRQGLHLLGSDVLPSLFPFLVLSSYLSLSGAADGLCRLLRRCTKRLFRMSEGALIAVLMGLIGGYPVGPKTAADLYRAGRVSRNEAERLIYFTANVSPAFAVSFVGLFTLRNAAAGALLYAAAVLSALTVGWLCRFLADGKPPVPAADLPARHAVTGAVASATQAALSVAGWVLTFAVGSALLDNAGLPSAAVLFLRSVIEVTTGCRAVAGAVALPVTAAVVGFGGLAVLCQIAPYAEECGVPLRRVFALRGVNAALCALYAEGLTKLFPQAVPAAVLLGAPRPALSAGVPAAALLTVTAAIFVLEVDNRRKTCYNTGRKNRE